MLCVFAMACTRIVVIITFNETRQSRLWNTSAVSKRHPQTLTKDQFLIDMNQCLTIKMYKTVRFVCAALFMVRSSGWFQYLIAVGYSKEYEWSNFNIEAMQFLTQRSHFQGHLFMLQHISYRISMFFLLVKLKSNLSHCFWTHGLFP